MTTPQPWPILRRWLPHLVASVVLSLLMLWDREIYAAIGGYRPAVATWLTGWIAELRGATFDFAGGLALIGGGLIAGRRTLRRAGVAVVLTVVLSGATASVMKEVISRPGPERDDPPRAGVSWWDAHFGRFPSTHAAVTFGAASALAAFVPAAAVPGFAFATLVSYERIYRGTHYPSDIFAGAWVGLSVAQLVLGLLRKSPRDGI